MATKQAGTKKPAPKKTGAKTTSAKTTAKQSLLACRLPGVLQQSQKNYANSYQFGPP